MLNKNSANFTCTAQKNIFLKNKIKKSYKFTIKKVCHNVISKQLHKDEIEHLKLIGQFDKKFILMFSTKNNSIILFDQHAIHERILYEYYTDLLADEILISNNENKCETQNSAINKTEINYSKYNLFENIYSKLFLREPVVIPLPKSLSYIYNTSLNFDFSKINNLFEFEFILTKNKLKIFSVPVIFDKTFDLDTYVNILVQLIQQINEIFIFDKLSLPSIKNGNLLMEIYMNLLKSRACRDAVKFNEQLDDKFVKSLLYNLAECNNPFLCAHGRHNFFIMVERKR